VVKSCALAKLLVSALIPGFGVLALGASSGRQRSSACCRSLRLARVIALPLPPASRTRRPLRTRRPDVRARRVL